MTPRSGPIAAAIAILVRDKHVVLVRRANPPDRGLWGFPGGRIEAGETVFAAAERELHEETGLTAQAEGLLDAIDVIERKADGTILHHFILLAVACTLQGPAEPIAADDALEAAWFDGTTLADQDGQFSGEVARLARLAIAAGQDRWDGTIS